MVRIRLRRVGSKNQPSYRIVAAEKESPRDGRFLEALGHYNPRTEPSTIVVDEARLFHWMQNGAQPSDSVFQTLKAVGTWERWERFKQGEPIEKLLEEAKKAATVVDPRTRRDDLFGQSKKKQKSKEAAKEVPAAVTEAVAEAEPEAEAVVAEAEPEAVEAEAVVETEAEVEPEAEAVVAEAEPEAVEAEAVVEAEAEAEPEAEEVVAEAEPEAVEAEAADVAEEEAEEETEVEEEQADEK